MNVSKYLAVLLVFLWSLPVVARLPYLGNWQAIYPDSNADDINGTGCQLCHRDDNGGDPWNAYGWEIRNIFLITNDITDAINTAGDFDHDADPLAVKSVDEISRDFQPGWTADSVNSIYFKDGAEQTNQLPPTFSETTTALDFPSANANPLSDIANGAITIELSEVAGDFNAPLKAVHAPGINGSLFVVEQTGKIHRVDLASGEKSLFHDVSADLVDINPGYDERGLLGLEFHPDFANNGLFYTYQSEPVRAEQKDDVDFSTVAPNIEPNHRSIVVEYLASDPSCNSFIQKRQTLLIIDQPQGNHNGGDLAFGDDGMLYIALGDGGGAHDEGPGHGPRGTGRDNTNPLGSILRIDVNGNNSANGNYGVPAANPFVGGPGIDEIFAYGFRNPYRMSFDATTGDLYAGDVGQGDIEEVDVVTSGGNYGWNWLEGSFYFYNSPSTGNYVSDTPPPGLPNDLVAPIAEYDHGDGISVIGGYVYRGTQIPVLQGRYLFGEFNKRLLYLSAANQVVEFLGVGIADYVTGFAQDADNELYVLTNDKINPSGVKGKLQKIMASGATYTPPVAGEESAQCPVDAEICVPIKAANGKIALICL